MNIEDIKKKIKKIKKEFYFVNIGIIALGLLLVIFPGQSLELICRCVGGALGIWGLFRIWDYIRLRQNNIFGSFSLVQGCSLLGFGIYILARPDTLAAFIIAALSLILLIGAVLKLQYGLEFASFNSKVQWLQAAGAVIMIASSIVAFINPFETASVLMIFLGIFLIVDGIWDLLTIIFIYRFVNSVKEDIKTAKKSRKKDNKEYIETEYYDEDDFDEDDKK